MLTISIAILYTSALTHNIFWWPWLNHYNSNELISVNDIFNVHKFDSYSIKCLKFFRCFMIHFIQRWKIRRITSERRRLRRITSLNIRQVFGWKHQVKSRKKKKTTKSWFRECENLVQTSYLLVSPCVITHVDTVITKRSTLHVLQTQLCASSKKETLTLIKKRTREMNEEKRETK